MVQTFWILGTHSFHNTSKRKWELELPIPSPWGLESYIWQCFYLPYIPVLLANLYHVFLHVPWPQDICISSSFFPQYSSLPATLYLSQRLRQELMLNIIVFSLPIIYKNLCIYSYIKINNYTLIIGDQQYQDRIAVLGSLEDEFLSVDKST